MPSSIGGEVFRFNFCNRRYRKCQSFWLRLRTIILWFQYKGKMFLGWYDEAFQIRRIAQLEDMRIISDVAAEITGYAKSEDRRISSIFTAAITGYVIAVSDFNSLSIFFFPIFHFWFWKIESFFFPYNFLSLRVRGTLFFFLLL